jgi:hypothetical protein
MESADYKDEKNRSESTPKSVIHSKTIRAGKRTYFFDVKSTRNNEYYLTITESKRKYDDDGKFYYEKHKVFLYPEDFDKFTSTMLEMVEYIDRNNEESGVYNRASEMAGSPDDETSEKKETDQEEVTAGIESEVSGDLSHDIDFDDI